MLAQEKCARPFYQNVRYNRTSRIGSRSEEKADASITQTNPHRLPGENRETRWKAKMGSDNCSNNSIKFNVTVNVAAARNRCLQVRRDPPLTFNRLFVRAS